MASSICIEVRLIIVDVVRSRPAGRGAARFQHSFAQVRVHDDAAAHRSAEALWTRAYAAGQFASDSATLTTAHVAAIATWKLWMAEQLHRYPNSFITLVGHTDATDTEAHNEKLGQQRADAVLGALTEGEGALPAAAEIQLARGVAAAVAEAELA